MGTCWCTVCGAETDHERVPCPDGHGTDCPERVCVRCDYVAVVGALVEVGAPSAAASAA